MTLPELVTAVVATSLQEDGVSGNAYSHVMDRVERELLAQALAQHRSNQVQTANFLGITRNTLRAKIEKYRL